MEEDTTMSVKETRTDAAGGSTGGWRPCGWNVVAVACTLLAAWPAISLYRHGVSLLTVASESLGYRYFYSLRAQEGHERGLFLPQGQSLTAIHLAFNWGLSHLLRLPVSELRARTDLFGYGTLLLNGALIAGVLLGAANLRGLRPWDRVVVMAFPVIAIFSSSSGLSAIITPDYYGLEIGLSAACMLVFLVLHRNRESMAQASWGQRWRRYAAAGCLAGVCAATKISLLGCACVAAAPLFLSGLGVVLLGEAAIAIGVAAAGSALLIVLGVYRFDLAAVRHFCGSWLSFVRDPGGEAGFWTALVAPWGSGRQVGASYGYAWVVLAAWAVSTAGAWVSALTGRQRQAVAALGGMLVVAAAHFWGLWQRPAGTTLFELGLFLTASGLLAICLVDRPLLRGALALLALCLLGGWAAINAAQRYELIVNAATFRRSSEAVWQAHAQLAGWPHPVIVYIPDNEHTCGSVEEAIMKGMSDCPSWEITTGRALLSRLAPNLTFCQKVGAVPAGAALMWIDAGDQLSLGSSDAVLRAMLQERQMRVQQWDVSSWPWWHRTLNVAFPSEGGQER
jgi:hypothetical protein